MVRKAGQLIARGQSTWLVRVYLERDPRAGTRKYATRPSMVPSAGAAVPQPQAAAARQRPSLSGRSTTKSQPIARPVADDRGQGASQDEKMQGL
jgi:hypothetical protein